MNTKRTGLWLVLLTMIGLLRTSISAQDGVHTVTYDNICLEYPASLASGIRIEMIEEIPLTDYQIFAETYPRHLRVGFLDYGRGSRFRSFLKPQILLYATETFPDFGNGTWGFPEELDRLTTLLDERTDLSAFVGASDRPPDVVLPFLPWVNSRQVLRSSPQYLTFGGGTGIRYLTYYSQDATHITDQEVFYTFQGLTNDGEYYMSVILPVKTGVLPEEVDTSDIDWNKFAANYQRYLAETFEKITNLPDEIFSPSLYTLDELVRSITIKSLSEK